MTCPSAAAVFQISSWTSGGSLGKYSKVLIWLPSEVLSGTAMLGRMLASFSVFELESSDESASVFTCAAIAKVEEFVTERPWPLRLDCRYASNVSISTCLHISRLALMRRLSVNRGSAIAGISMCNGGEVRVSSDLIHLRMMLMRLCDEEGEVQSVCKLLTTT